MATKTPENSGDGAQGETGSAQIVTYAGLQESHGANAYEAYNKICNAGGFGSQSRNYIGEDGKPTFPDLDFSGLKDLAASGDAEVAESAKSQLATIKKILAATGAK